jgi:hypothetical protein
MTYNLPQNVCKIGTIQSNWKSKREGRGKMEEEIKKLIRKDLNKRDNTYKTT